MNLISIKISTIMTGFEDLPLELKIHILKLTIGNSREHLQLVQSVHPSWLRITFNNDVMAQIFDAEVKNNDIWQAYMSPSILQNWHRQSKKVSVSDNKRNEYYQAQGKEIYNCYCNDQRQI